MYSQLETKEILDMEQRNESFYMNEHSRMKFDPVILAIIMFLLLGLGASCWILLRFCRKRSTNGQNTLQMSPVSINDGGIII